ncbi:DEK domain-containing chromatin-associated protein 4-like [Nicotiana sylvestris]|uniref:DEK domain-containing chromatin-associated protein 4-like n=1 Tax=Nicotiana sylvestris TaxID=4096 RepID=UPI00388C83D7
MKSQDVSLQESGWRGELSNKLDAQLKAIQAQEPQNFEESFKSATEEEENGSSNSEQSEGARGEERGTGKRVVDSSPTLDTWIMAVYGVESGTMKESVKKTRGSGSGEATEVLVKIGQNADEPGSSVEETLTNLLKKTSGTARANKKRKAAPSDTVEIPPTRRRSTRSQLKQNEVDLQRALEESKMKKVEKGKKNVGEPVDVDEMDLVHQDEDVNEEVEVQTPKPKKAKTSIKKSTSKSTSAKPSTLAKRTRSAVKTKKVKVFEEEEWSGEEEKDDSETKKDKMAKFDKRTILKGRLLRDLKKE